MNAPLEQASSAYTIGVPKTFSGLTVFRCFEKTRSDETTILFPRPLGSKVFDITEGAGYATVPHV